MTHHEKNSHHKSITHQIAAFTAILCIITQHSSPQTASEKTADIFLMPPLVSPKMRKKCRNSTLTTCHFPDLGSASDWLCCKGNLLQPVRRTRVVLHHLQMEFLYSCTPFSDIISWENSGGIMKWQLFSQATQMVAENQISASIFWIICVKFMVWRLPIWKSLTNQSEPWC